MRQSNLSLRTRFAVGMSALMTIVLLAPIGCSPAPKVEMLSPADGVAAYPVYRLANERVELLIAAPDPADGFYRGARFDHSGIIVGLTCDGVSFVGPWHAEHKGVGHDDLWGLADEFGIDMALGYDEVEPGGTFVKIGVGELERTEERDYSFARAYPIVNAPAWTVEGCDNAVTFTQTLQPVRGWGYRLSKTIQLTDDGLVIKRTLTNTGAKTIDTEQYNHNFLRIAGDEMVDGEYLLTTPFPLVVDKANEQSLASTIIGTHGLTPAQPLDKGSIWLRFTTPDDPAMNELTVSHVTGPSVRITGDAPMAKLVLWSQRFVFCPEPFVNVHLEPGQTMSWSSRYELDPGKAPR